MIFLIIFTIGWSSIAYAIEKRSEPLSYTTSVCIPCHALHAKYLSSLLNALAEQTVSPDEVVISLSDMSAVSFQIINLLRSTQWPFSLQLLLWNEKVSEGDNRNRACSVAKGDILICQDADDLLHSQRIEIIKYFFSNYDIDYLLHSFFIKGWKYNEDFENKHLEIDQLGFFLSQNMEHTNIQRIATGPISIRRDVFKQVQWSCAFMIGADVKFFEDVRQRYSNGIILPAKIYFYNPRNSSYIATD